MTLVISDVSSFGIVMVGDSAVTNQQNGTVSDGAAKVQYSPVANVGFALWGNANVGSGLLDEWLAGFISTRIGSIDSVEEIGQRLATDLNSLLLPSGRSWKSLVRGIHLTGYRDGLPVLFHVHCGHPDEPPHELRLYRDFPEDHSYGQDVYRAMLTSHFLHLRNGYHALFGPLFESSLEYSANLNALLHKQLPHPSLEGRLDFYKLLVKFVAGTLKAARLPQEVNEKLSAVAFSETGLMIDERLPVASLSATPSFGNFFMGSS
jgi:hypothetical protein